MKLKYLVFLVIFGFSGTVVHAQDERIDSLLDQILFGDTNLVNKFTPSDKFQFLYTRVNYDTKTFFAGRDIGFNQYNMTGQISWFHSSGISLGAAAVFYSEMTPKINTVLLSAGYSGRFAKSPDYRFRISYDRFLFPSADSSFSGDFNSSVSGGLTIDKRIVGSRLDYSLLMGKAYSSQVSWDIYGNFGILRLGKSGHIRFEPKVSCYLGSDQTIFSQVNITPGKKTTVNDTELKKFGWMNTELKLPVTVDIKGFDIEIGYNINFPRSLVANENLESTSYFNFSFGYFIPL